MLFFQPPRMEREFIDQSYHLYQCGIFYLLWLEIHYIEYVAHSPVEDFEESVGHSSVSDTVFCRFQGPCKI